MMKRARGLLATRALYASPASRSMSAKPTIVYTMTDEAPALATYSLLPIIKGFVGTADINVRLSDISLAARILAAFPEKLKADQQVSDEMAILGALSKTPEANIIKLPNISASVPQMKAAIDELKKKATTCLTTPRTPRPRRNMKLSSATAKSWAVQSTPCSVRVTLTAARPQLSSNTQRNFLTAWGRGSPPPARM